MHLAVFIKQVPDTTEVKINPETGTLIRTGVPSIINPYDHFALQSALELKKKHGFRVTVISMGPLQAKSVVQLALALGADDGVLLSDMAFAGSDTWATSYALSRAAKKAGRLDLILCGMQAIDGDTAQVGPGVAQQLGIAQVTNCLHVDLDGKKFIAKKLIDNGYEMVEVRPPALFTMIMPPDYAPGYPSFPDIHAALAKPYQVWSAEDIGAEERYLGLKGSPTQVNRIYPPPLKGKAQMTHGSAHQAVEKLLEIMKKERFIEG